MAKYFNLITVDTPTGLTATPQAGGSLPIGTTYYYRVIAFRRYQPPGTSIIYMPVMSAPTAEVSATTDSSNRTIALSWNAVNNAFGYVIQRTTTPGYYPVGGQNTFGISRWTITTLTSLVDNGTKSWTFYNADHTEATPLTEVYSDNNDTIYSYEILDAAISAGWTHVRTLVPPGIATAIVSDNKMVVPLSFNGGLYIRSCKFQWCGPIMVVNGSFYSDANVEFLQGGINYAPMLFTYGLYVPGVTNDNVTDAPNFICYSQVNGSGQLKSFIARHLCPVTQSYVYGMFVQMHTYSAAINMVSSDIGHRVSNNLSIASEHSVTGMNLGTVNVMVGDNFGPSNIYGSLGLLDNTIARNVRFFTNSGAWFRFCGYSNSVLANPYFEYGFENTTFSLALLNGPNYSNHIMYDVTGIVSDKNGNPIEGAKVYLFDAKGNSALFENLGVTCSTSLNDTDTYSSFVVSNATGINIGDVLRLKCGAELFLVTNKAGNTLTVLRGYGGTGKRKTRNYLGQIVLRQLPYVLTDSAGRFSQLCLWKEWYGIVGGDMATVPTMVANGNIGEVTHTPHTLRIEAEGYATYEGKITVDRRLDLEIALSPPGGGGGVFLRIR